MRLIRWADANLRTVATWAIILGVVFFLGVCTGIANAQTITYNEMPLRDYMQPGAGPTSLTVHDPDVAPDGSAWIKQTVLDGIWTVPAAPCGSVIMTICATNTDANNTDQRIVIDTGVNDHWLYIVKMEWNAGLIGVVVSADDSQNQNWIMIWYDPAVPNLTVGKLVNGTFSVVANGACNNAGATGQMTILVFKEGPQYTVIAACEVSGVVTLTPTITDTSVTSQTHVGLFNRNSATNYWGEVEFRANVYPVEVDPVDFTPFVYISVMMLGLAITGLGEYRHEGMYLMAGGVIMLAGAIALGYMPLMLLVGIAQAPIMYRSVEHSERFQSWRRSRKGED